MRPFSSFLRLAAAAVVSGLLLAGPAQAQKAQTNKGSYPAAEGFDQAGSDPKAVAIADKRDERHGRLRCLAKHPLFLPGASLGGNIRFGTSIPATFTGKRDTLVANYNLNTKKGEVYSRGQDISATPAGQKVLDQVMPIWINNSYWLVMPFKLKDSGVTLTYKGEGKTMDGAPADILQMTFKNVGVTPR